MKINGAAIIVMIIVLLYLTYLCSSNSIDNFVSVIDDAIIPKNCYNYLVTNGKNFFLLDTRRIIDGTTNPLTFNSKQDAMTYLKSNKCSNNIPYVDLRVTKKVEDPTVSYQRVCNKKVAPNLFNLDVCNTYGSDYNPSAAEAIARLNNIENDKKIYSNYDMETCMIDNAITNDPELDDTNFKAYFSQYFNNMDSTIDEKFMYMTGN